MRSLLVAILTLLLGGTSYSQTDTLLRAPVTCPDGEWELVFSDEFDANNLDDERWFTWYPYTDDGSDSCSFCRTHGDEGQVYTDDNIELANGNLVLTARQQPAEWMGERRDYTSGMIHSKNTFGMGRYEVRCSLPQGMGFWPAIWLFGNLRTELDIMEAGMQRPRRYHTSIHNRLIKEMLHRRHGGMVNLAVGFHTYSMEWDTNFITFAVDGKKTWRVSTFTTKGGRNIKRCNIKQGEYKVEPMFPSTNEKMHLIINLAVGSENTPFTGSPDRKTAFPNRMEVDYIRYYKRVN